MASGKRAIVRRRPPSISQKWAAVFVDLEVGNIVVADRNLSKSIAYRLWKDWEHSDSKAVCIPWPEGVQFPLWMAEKVAHGDCSPKNDPQPN